MVKDEAIFPQLHIPRPYSLHRCSCRLPMFGLYTEKAGPGTMKY